MRKLGAILAMAVLTASGAQAQWNRADLTGSPPQLMRATVYSVGASALPTALGATVYLVGDQPASQAMGIGLVAAGLALGPSIGSLYLNDERRALIGTGLRSAGLVALATGFGLGFIADTHDGLALAASSVLMSASVVLIPYGLAFSFITLPNSARDMELTLGPALDPESRTMMPAVVVRF